MRDHALLPSADLHLPPTSLAVPALLEHTQLAFLFRMIRFTTRSRRAAGVVLVVTLAFSTRLLGQSPGLIEIHARGRTVTNRTGSGGIRVLLIGNSLTYFNEMPWMLERMSAKSPAVSLFTQFSGASGMTLRQHWERGKAVSAIRSGKWDYVVLQGQSTEPRTARDEFFQYARLLDGEIRNAHARTVLLETWARRGEPQASITRPYLSLSRKLGALLAPAGEVWEHLTPRYDFYNGADRGVMHPNLLGSYLAACVIYATVTGQSPVGLPYTFDVHFDIKEFYRQGLENERISSIAALDIQKEVVAERPPR